MRTTSLDLGKLVAPYDPETFLRDYWERQPLVLSRDAPGYYAGLLSTADVDQIIAFTRPRFDDVSAFAREPRRESSYVKGWLADHREGYPTGKWPGVAELQGVYSRGKTVVIMAVQQRWLPVATLCRDLESFFVCPVHANMYLTPEGAQGFDTHFDTHEVFVLQLEGSKNWRVYGSPRPLPAVEEHFDLPKDELGAPREVRLEPGDLLYLPRGFVHEAFTSDCASLHLTIGVNVFRWSDVMHEALADLAARDVRFRESVPAAALDGSRPPEHTIGRFQELLAALARDARLEGALAALGNQFFESLRPLPGGAFLPAQESGIGHDTLLEKSPGMVCRVAQNGGWVEITFPGGRVGGPLKIGQALRQVARAGRLRAGDLPDELGVEGKLVLARRLVRERLLRVAAGGGERRTGDREAP